MLAREEPLHTVASSDFGDAALGPPIPFQPPMTHDARGGQQAEEGRVREALPRRAAAGRARRHERRRHLRRHAGDLHRRARRQAVQLLRRVRVAVPDAVGLVHQPVAPAAVRDSGLLADAVLLRLRPVRVLRHRLRLHRPRSGDRDADRARRDDLRHLSAQPLHAARDERRVPAVQAGIQRAGPAGRRRRVPAGPVRPRAVRRRPVHAASASTWCGRRRSSASTGRSPATRCRLGYEYAPSCGQPAVPPDRRRRCALLPCGSAPTACWRSAAAATRAGASTPATCTSAATRRCAATTTCSSSATRDSSPTPSCGSRSSRRP